MAIVANYFEQAQLSLAAYALSLQRGAFGSQDAEYVTRIVNAGMSQKQAEVFADTYAVIDQFADPVTGFSATVFDKAGVKYFAIRGTENLFSFSGVVDWLANVGQVGPEGIAIGQGLALFNYLQRLYGTPNSAVVQYFYDPINGTIGTATGTANGLLSGQAPLSITGHSLGGHLAMIMSRLAPNLVNSVYTYNAPGFDTTIRTNFFPLTSEGFFNALRNGPIGPITGAIGDAWDSSIMTHLNVQGDVVHDIGFTPGSQGIIFSENAIQGVVDAHDIEAINDSLAIYNLFATLDPGLNSDPNGLATLTGILKAASNKPSNSLESALDSLRKLFQVNGWQTKTTIDDRQAYYTNLFALQDSISKNGVSNLTLTSLLAQEASTTVNNAQASNDTGLATRYALKELNPFVLSGNAVLYAPFGEALKAEHFSNAYLTDRVAFLYNLRDINIADSKTLFGRYLVNTSGEKILFSDLSTRTQIFFTPQEKDVPSNTDKRVIFGSDAADNITGQANADRLYGGDGNDILSGNDGADYLEGNQGNDILTGGKGDDVLVGGQGDDIYLYSLGDGNDHIIEQREADGKVHGRIIIDGTTDDLVASGIFTQTSSGSNVWKTPDGSLTLTHSSAWTIITPDGGTIDLGTDLQDGDFGIHLKDAQVPVTTREIVGDLTPIIFQGSGAPGVLRDDLGNVIGNPEQPLPGIKDFLNDSVGNDHIIAGGGPDFVNAFRGGDDFIDGGAGDDLLIGGEGNDFIDGGAGNDFIEGGEGNDFIDGGAGNDELYGHAGNNMLDGGAGDDFIFGNNREVHILGEGDNTIYGGEGNDRLVGGGGNNTIYGGEGKDVITGGAGNNQLFGGAGDDQISGNKGDDFIDGGEGNDNLFGGAGDDLLIGGAGDDRLYGGLGDDRLFGGAGDDTYVFFRGDGSDVVEDFEGFDRVKLIRVNKDEVSFEASGSDLVITLNNIGEQMTLLSWINAQDRIDLFEFYIDSLALQFEKRSGVLDAASIERMIANTAPVAVADSAFVQEDLALLASGNVLTNDTGAKPGSVLSVLNPGSYAGAYGALALATDGAYTYTLDNAVVQSLGEGVTVTDSFAYTVSNSEPVNPLSSDATLTVSIVGVNDVPVVANALAVQSAVEDQAFSFALPSGTFSDLDAEDTLIFDATLADGAPLSAWLAFNPGTQTFSGTPGNDEIGTISVKVTATDGSNASVSDTFDLNVINTNDAPVVTNAIADRIAMEDASFSFTLPLNTFADVDARDALTFSAALSDDSALPAWLAFNPATQIFTGTPVNSDVGTVNLTVTATDTAGIQASDTFELRVQNVNDAPLLVSGLADQTATEDAAFSFTVPADAFADEDMSDTLTYSATLADGSALPSWLTFNAASRTFGGTPPQTDVGGLNLKVTATDAASASVSDVFGLTVQDAPRMITGTVGAEIIYGAGADDVLDGVGGDDFLYGLTGNDTLYGGIGSDTLDVGLGADRLTGGAGNDTLDGGEGSDTYIFNLGDGVDTIQNSGNTGNDTLAFGSGILPDSLSLGLGSLLIKVGNGGDAIHVDNFDPNDVYGQHAVENFQFADGAILTYDQLIGRGFDIVGSDNDDVLNGTNVIDRLYGLDGNDKLDGGTGTDALIGGPGDDVYLIDSDDTIIENINEGMDTVHSLVNYALGDNLENLTLKGGAAINGAGNALNNVITGNSAANALDGCVGADTLIGGAGDDTYLVDNASDVVVEQANEGTDTVHSSVSYALSTNVENLTLSGSVAINGTGNSLNNFLTGNSAANTLDGGAGSDVLQGGDGSDRLKDGEGNNLLDGGNGKDKLIGNKSNELFLGGADIDTITTGPGRDIIAFNRGDGQDTLEPSHGEDNSLSLGGGIRYKDLALSKQSKNLIVEVGNGEKITLKEWYAAPENKSVLNLQVITDAMVDYDPNSPNSLLNKRVNDFDFTALVDKFDQAGKANKNLDHWSMMNSLLDAHLAGSDTEALGGDLAYQYGKNGTLAGMSLGAAHDVLNATQFGAQAQTLRPLATLQEGAVKLG